MYNQQGNICICGIGPGNPDYILPVVFKRVEAADVVVGGKRHLEIFTPNDKINCVFNGKLNDLSEVLCTYQNKSVVVLVSGDTGFHSLRRFITKEFTNCTIELIPGISSFQYMYSSLGLGYENAWLDSLHGTEFNFIEKVNQYDSVFLLTDRTNNYQQIAQELVDNGLGDATVHIGSRLSYNDELLVSRKAGEVIAMNEDLPLCSVIIEK